MYVKIVAELEKIRARMKNVGIVMGKGLIIKESLRRKQNKQPKTEPTLKVLERKQGKRVKLITKG